MKNNLKIVSRWSFSIVRSSAILLPVSVIALLRFLSGNGERATAGLSNWAMGSGEGPESTDVVGSGANALACSLLGIGLGWVSWLGLFLAGPNTIRNVFLYGFVNGGSAENAWGGPTLVGAWVTHAAIAIALVPIYLAIFAGLITLQRKMIQRGVKPMLLLVSIVICAAGIMFGVALFNQA